MTAGLSRAMTDWDQTDTTCETQSSGGQKHIPGEQKDPQVSSPRLLRSLKNKRDYLRSQFSQLHKTFSAFKLQRFQSSGNKDDHQAPGETIAVNGSHVKPAEDSVLGSAPGSPTTVCVSASRPLCVSSGGNIQRGGGGGGSSGGGIHRGESVDSHCWRSGDSQGHSCDLTWDSFGDLRAEPTTGVSDFRAHNGDCTACVCVEHRLLLNGGGESSGGSAARTGEGDVCEETSRSCVTMTVRGEGCMEDSHQHHQHHCAGHGHTAQAEHTHQHTDQHGHAHQQTVSTSSSGRPAATGQDSHASKRTAGILIGVRSASVQSEVDSENQQDHNQGAKVTETDDELPLGSEANSLGHAQHGDSDGVVLRPPVDKRLLSLRQAGGGGGGGSGQLLHSGWTSFNSDVSNLTSGSANSHSSVEWLLQGRQADPEQVLFNLGFGGAGSGPSYTDNCSMYSRVPERFLQRQESEAAQDEDGTQEGAPAAEGASRRNPSRAASAWSRARSVSSAMLSIKLRSSLQQSSNPLALFQSMGPSSLPPGSLTGSSPSLTPPGHPRSVLHPDNQRALAKQGFYGDNLPEGIEPRDLHLPHARREDDGEYQERGHSAEDRRKQYHKTRSKRRNTVESGDEGGDLRSQDSLMKSVDLSTTTESTDSGELSTSVPTTPGDVFLDRTPSPSLMGLNAGGAGPSFPLERLLDVDEQYLPDKGFASNAGGLSRSRQKLTEKYNADLDNDANYFVSPPGSRQPTVEKAATLTDAQAYNLEHELDHADGGGCGGESGSNGGGSRVSRTDSGDARTSRSGNLNFDLKTKSVTIVVSDDGRTQRVATPGSSQRGFSLSGPTTGGGSSSSKGKGDTKSKGGGMSFLSIVNAAVDRMSDSGSDHTLVDQHSSSSGSPRPLAGSESPGFPGSPNPGSESRLSGQSGQKAESTCQLQQGPVLFVYHKNSRDARSSPRDENDNLPDSLAAKGENAHRHHKDRHNIDDDLPRMSSIQSDSSGFGDAEVTGDAALEMSSLKVSNLGSSCESSTTMASTCTVMGNGNNSDNHFNNSFNGSTETATAHSTVHTQQGSFDSHRKRSQSTDDLRSDSPSAHSESGRRFVTTCYIPNLGTKGAAGSSAHKAPVRTSTSYYQSQPSLVPTSSTSTSGRHVRTQISMVLRAKDRSGRGFVEPRKNETPLSEELAMASVPGGAAQASSSTPRYASHHTVFSVPKLSLRKPTLDSTSSVDGSRGSGDELEHDDRALSYSSWSRELPMSLPRGGGGVPRHHHRYYPGVEGEEGDGGSGASIEGSSVYSCASTTDSIASGSSTELLDCQKLIRLINQPTLFKGRKAHLVHYRPKRHLRDWPALLKKKFYTEHVYYTLFRGNCTALFWTSVLTFKKLQEETRLAQYAMQKYKAELSIMETSIMVRYQMAYEDMTREDREDIEEVQHLWAEVRRQVMETEQLLTSRMKAVAAGNDNFNSLASIAVLHRMIELLKEQLFQKEVAAGDEEEDELEEEEEWEERERRRMYHRPRGFSSRYTGSWGELPRSPRVRGRHSSSASHLSPVFTDTSFDQMRSSLLADVRSEMRTSLNTLQDDLLKRDNEIHRLQLQLMLEKRDKKPRSTQSSPSSRSLPRKRRDAKETDV